MISSPFAIALLSALSTSALAQEVDNPLPAANLTADPLDRNLTTVEIPLDPTIPEVPSFTNETTPEAEINQTVAYFVAEGINNVPLAIIHGDIILSTEADLLLNAEPANTSEHAIAKRALSIFKYQNVWPGGVVKYKWQSEAAKGAGRLDAWTEATKRWTDMLPWLKFEMSPPSAQLNDDILTLVPTTGQFACFSPIGKAYSAGGNQMMLDDSCGGAGTYAHELGHTLGLYHEHMRPDRDDYVIIHCDAVWDSSDGSPADCSQSCRGYGCNFVKLDPAAADWSGPYDSLSLMHYSPYEFAKGPGPAIEARPGVATPVAHRFPTALDAKRVCELYSEQCTNVCGDGVVTAGEECDDGNNKDGDGCSASCKNEIPGGDVCGDGVVTGAEECDDGNTINGDGCSSTCKKETPNPGTCSVPTCNPWAATSCDITTTCTALGGATSGGMGQHLCACRHGYRASGYAADDDTLQVRLPWAEQGGRVFVMPGVVCDQLCDDWTLGKDGCKEVKEVAACY